MAIVLLVHTQVAYRSIVPALAMTVISAYLVFTCCVVHAWTAYTEVNICKKNTMYHNSAYITWCVYCCVYLNPHYCYCCIHSILLYRSSTFISTFLFVLLLCIDLYLFIYLLILSLCELVFFFSKLFTYTYLVIYVLLSMFIIIFVITQLLCLFVCEAL